MTGKNDFILLFLILLLMLFVSDIALAQDAANYPGPVTCKTPDFTRKTKCLKQKRLQSIFDVLDGYSSHVLDKKSDHGATSGAITFGGKRD